MIAFPENERTQMAANLLGHHRRLLVRAGLPPRSRANGFFGAPSRGN
jgi:hypothetical protein